MIAPHGAGPRGSEDRKKTLRGRHKFSRYGGLLSGISAGLRLLPVAFRVRLWGCVSTCPGLIGVGLRYAVASSLARRLGTNVFFGKGCVVRRWDQLEVGSNVSLHEWCFVDASGGLKVGNDVSIAHGCSILTFEHQWTDSRAPIRDQPVSLRPVVIGDDCWIGCRVVILSGAIIEKRVVVAAGAVLASGRYDGSALYGGVPARRLKSLATGLPADATLLMAAGDVAGTGATDLQELDRASRGGAT